MAFELHSVIHIFEDAFKRIIPEYKQVRFNVRSVSWRFILLFGMCVGVW